MRRSLAAVGLLSLSFLAVSAQTAPAPASAPEALPPPAGEVLFERHTESEKPAIAQEVIGVAAPEVTDVERSSVQITTYDLDARLTPATSQMAVRARITVRNAGSSALGKIALQISSALLWDSAKVLPSQTKLVVAQHLLDTDADHTGAAREVVLVLPEPLAPGASVALDAFYEGTVKADATRLTRIGASAAKASATDWDEISPTDTSLRGFGNVLWYPVASPALFLGDGAKLFQAIAAARLRNETTKIRLRLSVEYRGDPPVAAYFCGHRAALKAIPDDPDMPVESGVGVATAEFAEQLIGFRLPSLFLAAHREAELASLAGGGANLLSVETEDDAALPRLVDAAIGAAPLLQQWFGPQPQSALMVLDHTGEPFEDGAFVVAPVSSLAASSSAEALTHSLTHAWVQTGQPWMDEGLAQFMALLWTEQQQGRPAMVAQLGELLQPLTLAEPAITRDSKAVGEPIVSNRDELYYRRKAAAVWLMLRGIVGDGTLAAALTAWRTQPVSTTPGAEQAVAFEQLLEKLSGKDLTWFFRDWVLHDRGLAELSIVDVAPRTLPAGKGHDSGWLVAVTVHNDGAAEVEVPIVIQSGTFSTTKRMRVPAFGNVTDRVVIESAPTEVIVNDGTIPETTTSLHRQAVVLNPEP